MIEVFCGLIGIGIGGILIGLMIYEINECFHNPKVTFIASMLSTLGFLSFASGFFGMLFFIK